MAALLFLLVVPALTYVALSLTGVQRRVADRMETELSRLLGCEVKVGSLGIVPFNRVSLRNVSVITAPGDTALTVRRLGAGVRLGSLLSDGPLTVNYLELIGMDARLWRDSASAPLNIQPIIEALKPKDKNKPPTLFDLKVNTVLIRSSRASYDVVSEPYKDAFDVHHLAVRDLRADIHVPRIKNDDFEVSVKRMGLTERCGFTLTNLVCDAAINAEGIRVASLQVDLPSSHLAFSPMELPTPGFGKVREALDSATLSVRVAEGSRICAADLGGFCPQLRQLDEVLDIRTLHASGRLKGRLAVQADLGIGNLFSLLASAEAERVTEISRQVRLDPFAVTADGAEAARIAALFRPLPDRTMQMMRRMGMVKLTGDAWLDNGSYDASLRLSAAPGGAELLAAGRYDSPRDFTANVTLATDESVDMSAILPGGALGAVTGDLEANVTRRRGKWGGRADMEIDRMLLKGVAYTGLSAHADLVGDTLTAAANIDNENIAFHLEGSYAGGETTHRLLTSGELERFVPSMLNLTDRYPGGVLRGEWHADLEGKEFSHLNGSATLNGWHFVTEEGADLTLNRLTLNLAPESIRLRSDYADGELTGDYDFASVPALVRRVGGVIFPSLFPAQDLAAERGRSVRHGASARKRRKAPAEPDHVNDFRFRITVKETENPAGFFRLPVSVIYPVEISGAVSAPSGDMALNVDAPFLRQGNKLIENTRLSFFAGEGERTANLDLTTSVPTKDGLMALTLQADGAADRLDTSLRWKIDRERAYGGTVSATATFSRPEDEESPGDAAKLLTLVNIHRSQLTFNDSVWTVNPATVAVMDRQVAIDGLDVHRKGQYVKISGDVGADPDAQLTLDIRNFSLDYLFESLGIDKVMLGGDATGTFYARSLLSPEPVLETPGLAVSRISYNKTVLGDALVKSRWIPEERAITLEATIQEPEQKKMSYVDGAIYPMADSLDITFTVNHARVGFMEHYMEAFASDIRGYASGKARLWGNFKYIDLEGDVKAEDLSLKVNFTNTRYHTSDSVHFRPGLIDLRGIKIADAEGHTANLNGWVRHKFFKEPRFEFGITDARNFLSYNETSADNPVWYGKIYGNGSAFVKGEPGTVDISVDMSTAPRSTFTFVLSDQEVADEYTFLLFRDKNRVLAEMSDTAVWERDTSMDLVNRLRAMAGQQGEDTPSDYNISLQMRVTPDAQIILVMDPVGGDRIRAYGSGHLRMDYMSANNDLKMYGTYELDRGHYNFTLQDIIIKDFTIKPGSKVVFNGDPYNAELDIRAVYALNANLSDLDESFLQDKDLNRTNVPVHAVMIVTGDIRQPEIKFDLEFPTLTSDVYRKVRSIVSTDDMMNRQIIYLLALNRFYTPDYMRSTTKGNELVSVASSTISSQLGNQLGQISENWNIAPAFRSDRGDFSDVEVDVALSSRLLNNRLLFNGNFGYRDNSMNSSQFIGDFDLEYLLDRSGRWRLKAYNRYNDQNYYLRTAPTTQGVGVVLKRDFDSFLSFLRAFRRHKERTDTVASPAAGR